MSRPIDLMTYNIRLGVESSLAAVADAILAAGVPDVLALQEVGDRWHMGERCDQARVIAERIGLPHAVFAGALVDADGGRYGIALAARHPLRDVTIERLHRAEDEQRVLLEATVDSPEHGPITALATHLSIAADERLVQARAVGARAAAAAARGPVVLLGDLNDRPGTAVIAAARGPLVDCFEACGHGPIETFSVAAPTLRIDHAFCGGGLEPTTPCRVVREARASDHFPLIARVRMAG